MRLLRLIAVTGTILWYLTDSAIAHPGHYSLTEIEWNNASSRFEVAMRLRIADLEDALSLKAGARVKLESNADAPGLIREYLKEHISIVTHDHHSCRLNWVGHELELHDVWVYFEAESFGTASNIKRVPVTNGNKVEPQRLTWDELIETGSLRSKDKSCQSVIVRNSALIEVQPKQLNMVSVKHPAFQGTKTISKDSTVARFMPVKSTALK